MRPLQSKADSIAESKPSSEEVEQRVPGSIEEWDFSCSSNIVENDFLEFSSFSQPPTIATRQQHFWLACNRPEEFLTQPPSRRLGQNKQSVVSEELSAVITSHRRESALIISENKTMTLSHLDDNEVDQQTIESGNVCIEKTGSRSSVTSTCSPKIRSLESDDELVKDCQLKPNENTLPINDCPNAIVHPKNQQKEINLLVEDHVSNAEGRDGTINNVPSIPSPPPFPSCPPTHTIAHLSELKFPNDDDSTVLPVFSFNDPPCLLTKDTLVHRLSAGLTQRPTIHSLPSELGLRFETYTMKLSQNKQSKDVLANKSQSELKSDNPEAEPPVCKKLKIVQENYPSDYHLVSDDVPVMDHAPLTSPCVDPNSDHIVPVTPANQPHPSSVEPTTTTAQSLSSCLMSHRAETSKATATTNFTSNSLPEQRKIMEAKCLLG